ncbi:MAG: hypothetical protein K2N48_01495 [Muribaculaceae bacterium]|nr:hypothetical protein [Muribaculaceae bacterium]
MEPITIEYNEDDGFIVRQGDRYADWMGWDEMLGLIISLTAPKNFSRRSWMMTEEQHRQAYPWRYRNEKPKPKETLLLTMK